MIPFFEQISSVLKKHTLVGLVLIAVFFLGLISFQGFDVCDEGWYLSFYQQIFSAPETVEYNFAFWLTGVIGGIWYQLFPNGGILSFRFLTIIAVISALIVAYKILKDYLSNLQILVGLLMVMIVNDFGFLLFYYNHLSSLIAISTIYFLLLGIKKERLIWIGVAGLLTSINVFSRLPNVTLFAFALIFPVQLLWVKSMPNKYWIKQSVMFVVGSIIGILLIYIIMYLFGHLEIMQNSITGIFNKGKNTDSNHNIYKLLTVYIHEYSMILKSGVKIVMGFCGMLILKKWMSKYVLLNILWYLLSLALFIYIFKIQAIYSLYFIGFLGTIGTLFLKNINPNIKSLSFLAFIMMIFLPLGSDGGINNAGYVCIWLAIPLFFWYYYQIISLNSKRKIPDNFKGLFIHKNEFKSIIQVLIIGFFIIKIYNISNQAYFDIGSRFSKKFTIDNTLAKGVYTTEERAEIINDLLPELDKYVEEGDHLLAYDNIPMINFLTKTKPYLYISWVWVYDSETFKNQLIRAENEIQTLPIVVQQKFNTIYEFSEPVLDYMSETKEETYIYKRGRVIAMNSFLKRNNYKVVWSNSYFNILKPDQSKISK